MSGFSSLLFLSGHNILFPICSPLQISCHHPISVIIAFEGRTQTSENKTRQNTTSSILLYWAKFKHNFIPKTISTEHNMDFLWALPAEIAAITYIQAHFIPVYMFRSSDLDVEWCCYIVVVVVLHDCHSLFTLHFCSNSKLWDSETLVWDAEIHDPSVFKDNSIPLKLLTCRCLCGKHLKKSFEIMIVSEMLFSPLWDQKHIHFTTIYSPLKKKSNISKV